MPFIPQSCRGGVDDGAFTGAGSPTKEKKKLRERRQLTDSVHLPLNANLGACYLCGLIVS